MGLLYGQLWLEDSLRIKAKLPESVQLDRMFPLKLSSSPFSFVQGLILSQPSLSPPPTPMGLSGSSPSKILSCLILS